MASTKENPKSLFDVFKTQKFKDNLSNMASKYAIPALLATAGTGAIGGLLASDNKIDFESPSDRRKRILRSTLFPALTTAGAIAAFGGAKALSDIDTNEIDLATSGNGDNILDKFIKNHGLIPLGTVAGLHASGTKIDIPSIKSKNPLAVRTAEPLITFGVDAKGKNPIHQFIDINKMRKSQEAGSIGRKILNAVAKYAPRVKSKGDVGKVLGLTLLGTTLGGISDDAANNILY